MGDLTAVLNFGEPRPFPIPLHLNNGERSSRPFPEDTVFNFFQDSRNISAGPARVRNSVTWRLLGEESGGKHVRKQPALQRILYFPSAFRPYS